MYLIKVTGLYGGIQKEAFYRQIGDCFDLVNHKRFATRFERVEDCQKILEHKDWFCKQYNASDMVVTNLAPVRKVI